MATGVDDVTAVPASSAFIGSVNLVGQIADKLLSFGQIVLIAAILGANPGADLFFLASIVPLTIGFVVGEPVGRAYLTLLVRELDDRSAVALAGSALVLTAATTLVLTVVYDLIAVLLVRAFTPAGSGALAPWLMFSTIGPTMAVAALLAGILTWRHEYAWAAARVPLASGAGLVALGITASTTDDLTWIAFSLSVGYATSAAVLAVRVTRGLGSGWVGRISRGSLSAAGAARGMLVGPSLGGAIGGQVIVMIERVLAGTIGRGAVASVSYARGLATAPTTFAQAVGASSYPRLVRAETAGDTFYMRESFERGLRLCLYLGIATATFLILFGPDMVAALFQRGAFGHPQTGRVGGALVAFAASTFTGSVIVYLVSVIYGIGRFASILWVEFAIFVAYLAFAPAGVAIWGVRGLAAAFAIAQSAGVIAATTVAIRGLGMRVRDLARCVVLPIMPMAGFAVGVLGAYRLFVDRVSVPVALRGDVRIGGAILCLLGAGALLVAFSSLPEAGQLRRFVLRRPA